MLRTFAVASVVLLACSGCSVVIGIDGLVADRDDAEVGGVDVHEVTVEEYEAFFASGPSLGGQRPECAWNDSYEPGVISPLALAAAMKLGLTIDGKCDNWLDSASGFPKNAIACVDWCDAIAYCGWAGKHLCGKIGGGTLDITPPDKAGNAVDPALSEWYRACSNGGKNLYPYGNGYEQAKCNDENHGIDDVGSYPGCVGGYPGLLDMSGNVSEWEDACTKYGMGTNPPEEENCLRRGGAYYSASDDLTCTKFDDTLRSVPSNTIGFRCCR